MTEGSLLSPESPVPIRLVSHADWKVLASANPRDAAAASLVKFSGKPGQVALVPDATGRLTRVLFGVADSTKPGLMTLRDLVARLPPGDYVLDRAHGPDAERGFALAWSLGAYRFDRYKQKTATEGQAILRPASAEDRNDQELQAEACALARDLVNTPANDMGPAEFEAAAREVAGEHDAAISVITGNALLEAGYPAVHAVGRAASPGRAKPPGLALLW